MPRIALAMVLPALLLTACGGDDAGRGGADVVTITLADTDLGTILVDGAGRALYVHLRDGEAATTCVADCAQAWPPLTAPVRPGSGVGVTLLGRTPRPEGGTQVTISDRPLYYFAGDGPGDLLGHGFDDRWYAVSPRGNPVTKEAGT